MADHLHIRTADGGEHVIPARADLTLDKAIYLAGLWPGIPLCAGLGTCGLCRVRYESEPPPPCAVEERILGELTARDVRLACRHAATPGTRVELLVLGRQERRSRTERTDVSLDMALDLGTTSLAWRYLDSSGAILDEGTMDNPQLPAGADVVSRLGFAMREGGEVLARDVREAVASLVDDAPGVVRRVCLAGNPAMTYLLLGEDVRSLAAAPYGLGYAGGGWRTVTGLPDIYVPPQLGPFVGGDASAGLAAIVHGPETPRHPFLLADLGTNGEFLLALAEDRYLAASAPMGPALEGSGLRFGAKAAPGVIGRFELGRTGLATRTIGPWDPNEPPVGICGAAYLSLLAVLLQHGVVDATGRFGPGRGPIGERIAAGLHEKHGERRLALPHGYHLTGRDLEELVKVKAAFATAVTGVCARAGLRVGSLAGVHLAGAMGQFVEPGWLERLGFLPPGLAGRCALEGNTSLAGAALLLTREEVRTWLEGVADRTEVVDLAGSDDYQSRFLNAMSLTYVDT
jgi:uncharacterized 2Fe-2S/4Fe-4S cluster protein (DUF4445 family)/ferredoxin